MKILVIGGGMAGLTYAIVACKNGFDVTVAERNSRVGKKIAMTGNGKCNIGNLRNDVTRYNRGIISMKVFDKIRNDEYDRFLTSCGIYTYTDSEGRKYPLSNSASNVVDCLRYQLEKFGGKLLLNTEITNVTKVGEKFHVAIGNETRVFDKVVLACGSGSQAQTPNIGNIVPHDAFTPLAPSLVPVKIRNMDGTLNGLRVNADVTLYDGDNGLGYESGEVLFKDYGLSGICIFNLSANIARNIVKGRKGNYRFVLDVVPRLKEGDLCRIVYNRLQSGDDGKLFYGILHNKLAEYVVKCANKKFAEFIEKHPDYKEYKSAPSFRAEFIAKAAKNLTFEFDRLLDWSMSQVTAGGISENHIDLDTLELSNGVVALGEVLNVDGVCGGYNLYFAAASALYTFTWEQRLKAYEI